MRLETPAGRRPCEPSNERPGGAAAAVAGRRLRGCVLLVALSASLALAPSAPALAQNAAAEADRPPESVEAGDRAEAGDGADRRWWNAWSVASSQHRLYLGVWSAHTFESDFPDFFSNRGLGVQYRSLFGVSFVNSYGERSLAVGAERSWLRWETGPLRAMVGFRAGLIYGYDEKLLDVAGLVPVLPLVQPMAMIRVGPFGADIGWVPRVLSVSGGFFF